MWQIVKQVERTANGLPPREGNVAPLSRQAGERRQATASVLAAFERAHARMAVIHPDVHAALGNFAAGTRQKGEGGFSALWRTATANVTGNKAQ